MRRRRRVLWLIIFVIGLYLYHKYYAAENTKTVHPHIRFEPLQFGDHGILNLLEPRTVFEDWNDESMKKYNCRNQAKHAVEFPEELTQLLSWIPDAEVWDWIRKRISDLWPEWKEARSMVKVLPNTTQKNILVIPGILLDTDYATWRVIRSGGPLGELLQWSDLITGLYTLGHHITLQHDYRIAASKLTEMVTSFPSSCTQTYDLIYVDYFSHARLPPDVLETFRCRLRLLDVYGTQVMYNDVEYSRAYSHRSRGGPAGLHLKQFLTFYPQTPDNTFLGFVVTGKAKNVKKENIAVIYGKDATYLHGKQSFIKVLQRYAQVHFTMEASNVQLENVINEGVLSSEQYANLLDRAKVTSQIPYLEKYVGAPHVLTIDIEDPVDVAKSMQQALEYQEFQPFVPEEFTMRGYLERLSFYTENMDLCNTDSDWPPSSILQPVLANEDQSCEDACFHKGWVCEPMLFKVLNTPEMFKRLAVSCRVSLSSPGPVFPAAMSLTRDVTACVLQEKAKLFSCAMSQPLHQRLCPCRAYRNHQVALWDP